MMNAKYEEFLPFEKVHYYCIFLAIIFFIFYLLTQILQIIEKTANIYISRFISIVFISVKIFIIFIVLFSYLFGC